MGNLTPGELALERQRLKDAVSLDSWNEFIEQEHLPLDLLPALKARKPELIMLARRRPLTADEATKLYHLLVQLIRTNEALRAHTQETAPMVGTWMDALSTLQEAAAEIDDFANFRRREE